jgi:cyclomaltodextrinase / maltogenic alpha-amylase / neopullulanase
MNRQAVFHQSNRSFVLPIERNVLAFRLLTARDDIRECRLYYWKRSDPYPSTRREVVLERRYQDAEHDDFRVSVTFPETAHYIKYYFQFTDIKGKTCYFSEYGFTAVPPEKGFFEFLYANDHDVAKNPDWCKGIVYYEIFPERFATGNQNKTCHKYEPWESVPTRENYLGGDLAGIVAKLGYLKSLNVDCLYLTPIFLGDFNHKYATTDYYRIDPSFGTNEEFAFLVKKAHEHGIRVVLDGVFNHVGIHFPPFEDLLRNGEASSYKDWFYVTSFPLAMEPLNYECVGDYPYMPKLRTSNPAVRDMVLDIMTYWIRETGLDGWRLDVADEVDFSTWQFIRTRLKEAYPEALLLGETWGDAAKLVGSGDQLDSAMNYLFRDAMVDYFARERISEAELDHRIQHMLMKYPDHVNSGMYNCLGSHDTARFLTEAGGDVEKMMQAVACQMTFPGSPAIYYGDEVGMAGENDPGCRGGMVWDTKKQNQSLLDWHKKLTALRMQSPALQKGGYRTFVCDTGKRLFGFVRCFKNESVYVLFNRGSVPQTIPMPRGDAIDLITGKPLDFAEESGTGQCTVPSYSVKIIQLTGGEKPCVP